MEYLLVFQSVYDVGHRYSFECTKEGVVNLDNLSDKGRNNYYYCKTMVGREFAWPRIEPKE